MKTSTWATAGLVVLCIGAGVAWMHYLMNKPVPDPLADRTRPYLGDIHAKACDAQTGEGYVASGRWTLDEFGPVLEITPTDCGRKSATDSDRRDHLVAEVVERFSGNLNWRNTRGLINQLDCHAINYPDKPTWNIEPDRPYVGYRLTFQAQCNPSDARPDSPFE